MRDSNLVELLPGVHARVGEVIRFWLRPFGYVGAPESEEGVFHGIDAHDNVLYGRSKEIPDSFPRKVLVSIEHLGPPE